jgi:hypothetical protein
MGYIITGEPADDTEKSVIFGSRARKPCDIEAALLQ